MRLQWGGHARRLSTLRGSAAPAAEPTRPGHAARLVTEVELARLCGRNLAEIEAETIGSAEVEARLRDSGERQTG